MVAMQKVHLLQVDATVIFDVVMNGDESEPFTCELALALQRLWADAGLQQAYERRSEYQLSDSAK